MHDLNEYWLTDGWPMPITRLNDLNEFKDVRFGRDREMNPISKSPSSPNASPGGRENHDPALQIAACIKVIRSQSLSLKRSLLCRVF